ncbi:uncharacterized protein METZ01_LOCUS262397 [marine metagenome]|uniref:Uncharacterized protein n=1 Tax=marine metagenome TaxID=408172 RepID=A0A382JEK9_9ZZZZ
MQESTYKSGLAVQTTGAASQFLQMIKTNISENYY